ncbi:MAG: IMP cyclohydrolase / Phosphoribosylaminoimidazolecarboxamide formyltransferase [uncultured Solirubrobacterales bacterium]|uniref:Bifunctional purine biosynthesis protein PurH n=1 Tax=uncultured Solirubrobacterales bacterium TaxID=768556 RepID=A0A6J4T247_9ACTN|nr:MAG: IMP cyclohydrolase / Phosphoribosylaminoimidazolecarboxamide formyltransferase [uncultured Solirubrobacterales bacterium]
MASIEHGTGNVTNGAERDPAGRAPTTTPPLNPPAEVRVRRALISVSDKRGVVDFARGLADLGVELVSTGGTARKLADAGIESRAVEDLTGFPEMLDGRVKTLNPRIHAGLLAVRSNPAHSATLDEHEIEPIDLVCVNLYPFESTANRRGASDAEIIEDIDIGGPTMIRAAAKNHAYVASVVKPESYDAVLEELHSLGCRISAQTRQALALEAFSLTARYDAAVARWFSEREQEFPALYVRAYEKILDLSYGENPHQRAAYYAQAGARTHLLSMVSKLHGRELSFNNLLDLDAVRRLIGEFDRPAAAIVKHNNPCGCAVADSPREAFERALATDPTSAFGGVVCVNRPVDNALAEQLSGMFLEMVFAPDYDDDACELLQQKENLRIMRDAERRGWPDRDHEFARVRGGLLVQERDASPESRQDMEVVTQREPSEEEWDDLLFAWKVCKHVRSNAIVLARNMATVGIGAGQMSRVDSVRLAVEKGGAALSGGVMASDAFFPFADGPEVAIEAGVRGIIQPGGSRRDTEVIEACDRAGVAMVLTKRRHFRH